MNYGDCRNCEALEERIKDIIETGRAFIATKDSFIKEYLARIAELEQTLDAYIVEHDKALKTIRECADELQDWLKDGRGTKAVTDVIEKLRGQSQ